MTIHTVISFNDCQWQYKEGTLPQWKPKKGRKVAIFEEFRDEKGPSRFVTQCYIWAFSG